VGCSRTRLPEISVCQLEFWHLIRERLFVVVWRSSFTAVLAVVSFMLSVTVCQVACASGDDGGGVSKTVQHQCIGQCACQGATIPAAAESQPPLLSDGGKFGFAAIIDNSRLAPASIFNPPRA